MRGGKFEQAFSGIGSGGGRNAEALLESRSVVEVREVEEASRKEIEDKREELRQLVGASYRDLIDSADSIVSMAQICSTITDNLASMSLGLGSYGGNDDGDDQQKQCQRPVHDGRMRELYAIGSRAKYLVDTPEKIWGCLDEHMHLEGAQRYLRAKQVQARLLDGGGAQQDQLLAIFRLPLRVEVSFHGQIAARSREAGLGVEDYADALAAVAIVEELSSSKLLSIFLDSRRDWFRASLSSLSAALRVVQLAMCHLGQLFLGAPPLVLSIILTTPPSSQLFGGIDHPESELSVWKEHRKQLESRMVALSQESIARAGLEFVGSCADDLKAEAKPVLGLASSGKELAEMERSIRLEMEKHETLRDSLGWLKVFGNAVSGEAVFGNAVSGFGNAVSGEAVFGNALCGEMMDPWDAVSRLVLGKSVDLWEQLFERCFMESFESIIDSRIDTIPSVVASLDEHLSGITLASCLERPCIGLLKQLQPAGRKSCGSGEWYSDFGCYFGPEVCMLKDSVDERLKVILEDVLAFLGDPDGSSRTNKVSAYLHDRLLRSLLGISRDLESRLQILSKTSLRGPSDVVKVEQALFIGRLALALGHHLGHLPLLLGPPERWSRGESHSSSRHSSWLDGDGNREMGTESKEVEELQESLRGHWDLAYNLWVSWSTEMLVGTFSDYLLDAASYKGWEEITITQEVDVEINMSLPGSPHAVTLLFVATQEIYRVGGHILNKNVVHSFSTRLLDKVLTAYKGFVSQAAISEKGLLQLTFDVRFIGDVLVGMHDRTAQRDSKRRINDLISSLCAKLDPIDWATYEPQLWRNEECCYQRSADLFGFLTALDRLYSDFDYKAVGGTNANTLSLSPTVPRFAYLPMSVPSPSGATTPRLSPDENPGFSWESSKESNDYDSSSGLTSLVDARPLIKSFMGQVSQVGSKFGEGTLTRFLGDGWST